MKVLVFDPVGGASGDMILGSLVQLGCPVEYLKEVILGLKSGIGPADIHVTEKWVSDIMAEDIAFHVEEDQPPRKFSDIRELIEVSDIPSGTKKTALEIFSRLAASEANVHGIDPGDVHFHEVGAADSILDIVCISAAVEWFSPERIYTRNIPVGKGFIETAHGIMPVPAPATIELLKGMRVRFEDVEGELTTPTGAAVMQTLSHKGPIPSDMIINGVGYGCGDRQYDSWPNLFRSVIAEVKDADRSLYVVEADMDDMLPEDWDAVLERLFASGVLDANLTAKIMKKSRPGVCLNVIVPSEKLHAVLDVLLIHTSSIGARYYPVMRHVLDRRYYTLETPYGVINVKEVILPDGSRRIKPEYEDLKRLSMEKDIPVKDLRMEIDSLIEGMKARFKR